MFYEDIEANKKIGINGAKLLSENVTVLTHCNAGALATAGHGTALGIIRSAHTLGKKVKVFAGETRPFLQGARLTAWELVKDQIPVTLITDNMSGYLMSLSLIDAVIVGADRVTANGDVINKIGTYSLAVLASQHNIPFYVACPCSTIDIKTKTGAEVEIEERNPKEVLGYGDNIWAPEGVKVFNPAFDITPASLVSYLVTERGVVTPNNLQKLKIIQ
jgi:methylthioribose-1-phosphate isomerase